MRFQPVGTRVHLHHHWHRKRQGFHHLILNDGFQCVEFVQMRVEDQFIVHLQNHLRLHLQAFQLLMDANHGNLNHVGGAALDGRVDGIALGEAAHHAVGAVDVAEVTAAA